MWGIRYMDANGTQCEKNFKSHTARSAWIEKNIGNIDVLAYADAE